MEAFAELYRSSAADVYAYVATLLGDRAAAEDVTAQAFERAWRKRGAFDTRRGSPRAWVFGIARNAALDELRRRRRHPVPAAEAPDVGGLDDDAEAVIRRTVVRTALAGLDARDRELIALKFHGDFSNAELARLLATSESNVGTRVHRAVTRLREACHVEA